MPENAFEWEQIFTVKQFLQELESHCVTSAIVSLSSGFRLDLKRTKKGVKYGHDRTHKPLFLAKLHGQLGVVLRTFTANTMSVITPFGKSMEMPVKELRMYFVEQQASGLRVLKATPEACFAAQNTDSSTGEPLPGETAVEYR